MATHNRDWRKLVEDVLAGFAGREFTKQEFVEKCSDEAYIRFNGWEPDNPRLYHVVAVNQDAAKAAGSRYPYIGEKVVPWLLGGVRGRTFSRLPITVVNHRGFRARLSEVLDDPKGRGWVEYSPNPNYAKGWDTTRMTRVLPAVTEGFVDSARCPLKIKVLVVPNRVLDVKAPHFEDLLSLVKGNWRIAGDYLQDKDVDQELGSRLAQDPELSLLFAYTVLNAKAEGGMSGLIGMWNLCDEVFGL